METEIRKADAESLRERLRAKVSNTIDLAREVKDAEVEQIIDKCILEETRDVYVPLKEKVRIRTELFNSFRRYDVLTDLLSDNSTTEIMINGVEDIFLERDGKLIKSDRKFSSREKLWSVIQQIVGDCNRRINESTPIVDARLADGSRVNIVVGPVSLNGPVITIRKFPGTRMTMEDLVAYKTLDRNVAEVLRILVQAKYNVFVSGGTGSGKTTLLNILSDFIPPDERVITIEDSAELQITGVKNLVRLESRPANMEGQNAVTIRDLIKTSLRMRPDRIIVGEVRDSAAIDMLAAMGTGHDGSLSTGHANSAIDMLSRLETMVLMGMDIPLLAVKQQIASSVDIVIHLSRMRDGSRKVMTICEVNGVKNNEIVLNTLYEYVETGMVRGKLEGGLRKITDLIHIEKLLHSGKLEEYKHATLQVQSL